MASMHLVAFGAVAILLLAGCSAEPRSVPVSVWNCTSEAVQGHVTLNGPVSVTVPFSVPPHARVDAWANATSGDYTIFVSANGRTGEWPQQFPDDAGASVEVYVSETSVEASRGDCQTQA